MTPEERQQSLAAARRACEYLRENLFHIQGLPEPLLWHFERLAEEFTRLDAGEEKRNEAGRESGHLGAQYGHLGGRPRKTATKKRGKK